MLLGGFACWSVLYRNLATSLWWHAEGVACEPDVGVRFSLQYLKYHY